MRSFEQISEWVAQKYTVTVMEPYLLGLQLSMDHGNRHQSVFLSELIDEDTRKVLRISTVVADGEHSRDYLDKALAFNWQSRSGFLAAHALIAGHDAWPWVKWTEKRTSSSAKTALMKA